MSANIALIIILCMHVCARCYKITQQCLLQCTQLFTHDQMRTLVERVKV